MNTWANSIFNSQKSQWFNLVSDPIILLVIQPQARVIHTFHCLQQQLFHYHPGASGKFKPLITISISQQIFAISLKWYGRSAKKSNYRKLIKKLSCKEAATYIRSWTNTTKWVPIDSFKHTQAMHTSFVHIPSSMYVPLDVRILRFFNKIPICRMYIF